MKIRASGEDYLEALLVLQTKKGWCAPLTLPVTWVFPNQASVTQSAYCVTEAF